MSESETEGQGLDEENDVIFWSEKVEDHTLAVLEGDLEDDFGVDFSEFDGRTGVAETNTERYVTDFEDELSLDDGELEVSVEREGGLNTIEYWSEDPDVMGEFKEYIEARMRSVEQRPMLEPYKFEDVRSDEVGELVGIVQEQFEVDGPLPRGSNGQPRMHLQRFEHVNDQNEYKETDEASISPQHKIPGDAEYRITGINPEVAGDVDVDATVTVKPQKHDVGLYTVEIYSEEAESLAHIVNTSVRAIDPDKDHQFPI